MASNNESTTRFKADISQLKKAMQDAQRQIRLANSEFQAATAGMDDWSKSADGVSAKLNQLRSVLDSQKSQLQTLSRQYQLVAQAQGEGSREAQELLIRINNQRAAIRNTQAQIDRYNGVLEDLERANDNAADSVQDTRNEMEKLEDTVSDQQKELDELKRKYNAVAMEQGESSDEAQELARQITQLSGELAENRAELERAGRAADEFDQSIEDAAESSNDASGGFTILKGTLASLAAEGIKACAQALADLTKELITDGSNAYAQFAAQTGTATDAMGEYEEAIKSVYKNNFGESLEDVAEKMAKVKEVTGELDASNLQDMTEKAITLEDTFGMDMVETLRGVNSLMTHFGLTSEQAFDLISSGAQNGLNYTDELGDNVAEYAGKFAEAGFSSEEYFQLLKNGAEGGAYNLDKVNDAVNEITTRLADGTIGDTMTAIDEKTGKVKEGTGIWSQETEKLFAAWQNGEATQKDVMASIVSDIQNAESEQEKMNLAAKAFGTMAEDGGTQFIEALSPVGDTFADVKGKADELAAVKYDTPQSAIAGIGRTLKTDLLGPLADKLMPYLNNLAAWVTENLPTFIENAKEVGNKIKDVVNFIDLISPALVAVGVAIAGLAIVGLIQNITAVGAAIKAAMMSTKLMTAAQWLLNAAMSANPIALVVVAITALVAAFVVLWNKSETFRNFFLDMWEQIKGKITEVWETYLKPVFTAIGDKFKEVWETYLKPALSALSEKFKEVFAFVKKIWETVLKPVFTAIAKVFLKIWEFELKVALVAMAALFSIVWKGIETLWNKVLKPVFQALGDFFKWVWEKVLKPALESAKEKFDTVFNAIKTVWNKILKPVFDAIGKTFKKVWEDYLKPAIDNVKEGFQTMSDGVKSIWDNLWNNILKPVINSILGGIESMANGAVGGVNKVIDVLNGLSFDIPDWVPEFGGKSFGFNIGKLSKVSLPRLESGGVLKRGQVGLLEGNGAEAVVPLENNKKWIAKTAKDLKQSLMNEGLLGTAATTQTVTNNYNFTQNNTSPKALSRLDIYRQTKNQLNFAKGV